MGSRGQIAERKCLGIALDLDGEQLTTYVLPPAFQTVSLGLKLENGTLAAVDDVSLLSGAASIGELKVLRALSQDGATPASLNEPMQLQIVIDDRAGQLIENAKLWVEGTGQEPVFAVDDGQRGDEDAEDKIYTAILDVTYQPMIQLVFQNGETEPVTSVVMLPEKGPASIRALVTPVGLSAVEAQNADITISAPLVVQAAPTGVDIQEATGKNFIEVTMILDDKFFENQAILACGSSK